MSMIDLFKKQITDNTWFSVTNIYFDNGFVINPHANCGYACISPSAECFFALGKIDSTNSELFAKKFAVFDPRYFEFQQTITCVAFDHFQHFDIALFSHSHFYHDEDKELVTPTYPKKSDVMAIKLDEETGLADGHDTAVLHSGKEVTVVPVYPNPKREEDYAYYRVSAYQQFIKTQEKFVAMVNKLYGLSDCM